MSSKKIAHLDRPHGHEIACRLMFRSMSVSDILEDLPYDDVSKQEVKRIINPDGQNLDMINEIESDGPSQYTLNNELFKQGELSTIRERAFARKTDKQPEVTEEDYDGNLTTKHQNFAYQPSKFGSQNSNEDQEWIGWEEYQSQ